MSTPRRKDAKEEITFPDYLDDSASM